ncbi:ABC transporter substrate-binding protein [Nocardiopsis sp. CNT-189]
METPVASPIRFFQPGQFSRGAVAAGAAALLLSASACGGGDGGGGTGQGGATPDVQPDEELAALVPQEVRDAGTLTVGTDSSYAPAEFLDTDGKTIIGFDVELFDAVAAKLDLDVAWESATFGTIVEGVDSGKYDAGISSFTINEERLEQVNMVSYYNVGTQWFTAKGNPAGVDPENACGKTIAVQANTVQVPDIEARSEQCEKDGEPAIQIDQYEGQDEATQSIVSGKSDAGLADMPVAFYAIEQTGDKLESLGEQYEAAPYGAVVHSDSDELAEAIQAGYQSIIDDGTYEQILDGWGLAEQGLIEKSEVNPDIAAEDEDGEA